MNHFKMMKMWPNQRRAGMGEVIIRPWVNGKTDENGDLHLEDGIDGPDDIYTRVSHTVMSLKQRETRKWLKAQGWASPEEKTELIEALDEVTDFWFRSPDGPSPEQLEPYLKILAKAKGEEW